VIVTHPSLTALPYADADDQVYIHKAKAPAFCSCPPDTRPVPTIFLLIHGIKETGKASSYGTSHLRLWRVSHCPIITFPPRIHRRAQGRILQSLAKKSTPKSRSNSI